MVIALGAYTRLSNAGLGCPDWPGCYGHLTVPTQVQAVEHIDKLFPAHPLVEHKAWSEMIHRYFAGSLGLVILALVIVSIRDIVKTGRKKRWWATGFLILLLIYQPLLGMWTVTLKLLPIVVSQHLLGGMSILALLWLHFMMYRQPPQACISADANFLRPMAVIALILLFCQIALGAWTSTNYAAIVCSGFPFCQIAPWHLQFHQAFHLFDKVGVNYQGGILSGDARRTIQMTHRFGALIVSLYLIILNILVIAKARHNRGLMCCAFVVWILLIVQVCLGIANVLLARPLMVSELHNLGAASLLVALVTEAYLLFNRREAV